jgi:hypothetical protein
MGIESIIFRWLQWCCAGIELGGDIPKRLFSPMFKGFQLGKNP